MQQNICAIEIHLTLIVNIHIPWHFLWDFLLPVA